MAKKEEAKDPSRVKNVNVVAEDTDWRTYVSMEIQAENDFMANWGFMTKVGQGKYLTIKFFRGWQDSNY